MKANFEKFPISSKIQTYDKDGYYVMEACGYVAKHLGAGHAVIQSFSGEFYSTVGLGIVHEIEGLK